MWSGWVAGGGKVAYHRPDQDKGGRSVTVGQGVQSRVARVARLFPPGPGQTSAHRKVQSQWGKLSSNLVTYSEYQFKIQLFPKVEKPKTNDFDQ